MVGPLLGLLLPLSSRLLGDAGWKPLPDFYQGPRVCNKSPIPNKRAMWTGINIGPSEDEAGEGGGGAALRLKTEGCLLHQISIKMQKIHGQVQKHRQLCKNLGSRNQPRLKELMATMLATPPMHPLLSRKANGDQGVMKPIFLLKSWTYLDGN